MLRSIIIKGARHHNLKNFDIEIPHEKLVVVTGVSGSGKTSLAFDTIYAEGQRRYVESLSSYARMFLELSEKPEADLIEGLSPSIAIQQRGLNASPRSIVGTTTEIYDYMRLLFARAGKVHCHNCGREITKTPAAKIVELILNKTGKKILVLSPVVSGRKGTYEKLFEDLNKEGYLRIIIDGTEYRLDEEMPKLDKFKKHDINLVVDRLAIKPDTDAARVQASVETALKKGNGKMIVKEIDGVKCEPVEMLTVNTPEECSGKIIEFVSTHKGEMTKTAKRNFSARISPAHTATSTTMKSSRALFRSTILRAHAPNAAASARGLTWMSIKCLSIRHSL